LSEVATNAEGQRILEQEIQVNHRVYRRIRLELVEPTRDGDDHIDL